MIESILSSCDRENCDAYKLQESACEMCPDKREVDESNLYFPLAMHVIWLYRLKTLGCVFRLTDLSKLEWLGLDLVDRVLKDKELKEIEEARKKISKKT